MPKIGSKRNEYAEVESRRRTSACIDRHTVRTGADPVTFCTL